MKTLTLHTFDELSPEAKATAREALKPKVLETERNRAFDDVEEDFKTELRELGYEPKYLGYGLGHVQGDGVWFKSDIYLSSAMTLVRRLLPEGDETRAVIERADENAMFDGIHYEVRESGGVMLLSYPSSQAIGEEDDETGRSIETAADLLRVKIEEDVAEIRLRLLREGHEAVDLYEMPDADVDAIIREDYGGECFTEEGKLVRVISEKRKGA